MSKKKHPVRARSRSRAPEKAPIVSASGPKDALTLFGVKLSHLNPEHPEHAKSIPTIKRTISRGMKSVWPDGISPYQHDLDKRIPRAEVDKHVAFIKSLVPSAIGAGSYRRGATTSSDIDIVVLEPIASVTKKLQDTGYIHHVFGVGNKKFSGIVRLAGHKLYRHLDIVSTTPESLPFALLYFTGPAQFNIVMRVKAKRKGFKLNEYGLWRDTKKIAGLTSERDIFAALGREYKEPHERK